MKRAVAAILPLCLLSSGSASADCRPSYEEAIARIESKWTTGWNQDLTAAENTLLGVTAVVIGGILTTVGLGAFEKDENVIGGAVTGMGAATAGWGVKRIVSYRRDSRRKDSYQRVLRLLDEALAARTSGAQASPESELGRFLADVVKKAPDVSPEQVLKELEILESQDRFCENPDRPDGLRQVRRKTIRSLAARG